MREIPQIQRQTVTAGLLMRSSWSHPAKSGSTRTTEPRTGFAEQLRAVLADAALYVGMLALIATVGLHYLNQLLSSDTHQPVAKPGWAVATRTAPAFAVSQTDSLEYPESYAIFRHPEGGRKEIFRWGAVGERPIAELEIYRPGGEFGAAGSAAGSGAALSVPTEGAGVINSKFGPVTLRRLASGADDPRSCLGFARRFDQPRLILSGWSCQGDTVPAERAAIGCLLSRLMLLKAGNDPKLAEFFAHAELRRENCASASAAAEDWVTTADRPALRGAF